MNRDHIKRSDALELTVYQSMMGLNMAQTKLREMPGEDVRPVVHGHWIERATDEICSVCGMTFTEMPFTYDLGSGDFIRNYCPNCGNPMDEKEEEG